MDNIITKELIQYKAGFINGKDELIELTRLGKIIDFNVHTEESSTEWNDYGYKDAIEYFSEAINKNIDITTIRVRDVIKEQYLKRVIKYNSENNKEIPISTFRI